MSKFGIIALGYQCAADFQEIISPWLNRDNFYIALVNSRFDSFPFLQNDNTKQLMQQCSQENNNVIFIDAPETEILYKEFQLRNLCVESIIKNFGQVDYFFILDVSDEYYSISEIDGIIKFIESKKNINWFNICFRNYVFDKNHYLEEEFAPPRIFKVNCLDGYKFINFYYDNDALYAKIDKNISYKELSNIKIPKSLFWIKHLSWLSNEISQAKIIHHNTHYKTCSYKWNDSKNCLEFNEEYYKKNNLPIPRVIEE
jgi:hypothetical protein